MIVQNMTSNISNLPIANQFIINFKIGIYSLEMFQSYKTIIAVRNLNTGLIFLDSTAWNYSTTTSKYRVRFLAETTQQTRKKINDGTYILKDLNNINIVSDLDKFRSKITQWTIDRDVKRPIENYKETSGGFPIPDVKRIRDFYNAS